MYICKCTQTYMNNLICNQACKCISTDMCVCKCRQTTVINLICMHARKCISTDMCICKCTQAYVINFKYSMHVSVYQMICVFVSVHRCT